MSKLTVETKYGIVEGIQEECIVFKGIPYAKPPVGELRFKAPQKPEAFTKIYKANQYPNRFAQLSFGGPEDLYTKEFYSNNEEYETGISEDALYLNIWTPALGKEKKYPVMFYIHGGGFLGGYGHEKEMCTDAYARKNIVLVTINYRLGIFGYLAHPWLEEEDCKSVGNYAVLDQMAALDWVRENIEGFGGNPDNITIFGQSAGGMSVETLLASPLAKGKFQQAIIQSASGYPSFVANILNLNEAEKLGSRVMELGKIASLKQLRELSFQQLLDLQSRIVAEALQSGFGLPFAPVVNEHVLIESVTKAIESGHMNKVPTIIGCTKNDITVTNEEIESGKSRMHNSDIAYSLKCEEMMENPAYVYYFQRDLPGDEAGAFHSAELWYMMGTYKKCWRPMKEEDAMLSEEMVTYWSNFAKNGTPNGNGVSEWNPCTKANQEIKIFDVKSENHIV